MVVNVLQTKVEKGGQQTAAKKEKSSLQQGQATEQKVQKRRRNVRIVYMGLNFHKQMGV